MIRRLGLQFFVRINSGLPPAFKDCFAMPGRYSFEAAFARRARRYRLSNRIVIALPVGFMLGLFVVVELPMPEAMRLWIVLPSAALQ
jgi:hypothetical protein